MDEAYIDLANAIVLTAVDDYRKALKGLKCNPNNQNAISSRLNIERFFFASWFEILTDLDPNYLVPRLKAEFGF